jgi:hypothetical protein
MYDTLLVALKAGPSVARHFLVALRAVVHLHAIPGVLLETSDIPAPYIAAVLGEAIVLVRLHVIRFPYRPMTRDALHFRHLHVGYVREKDTLRLAGINQPRDFFSWLHILLDELGFFRTLSYGLFVALATVC